MFSSTLLSLFLLGCFPFPAQAGSVPASAKAVASLAAAAKVDITPDLEKHSVYMAGFGAKGRKPEGVHDPLFARMLLLSDGERTLAMVGLDLLGFFREDVLDLRRRAGFDTEDRYLFVTATHQHSGPDTLGMWGPLPGVSGVDDAYMDLVKERIAQALRELEGRLEPARIRGFTRKTDPRKLCKDSRDPVIIDPGLGALSVEGRGGKAIATLVNWSCHPEVLGPSNLQLTADFPGPLCKELEERRGGTCLFLPGAVGGLMTPDHGAEDFDEAHRIGTEVARRVLEALAKTDAPRGFKVGFRSETVSLPVENSRYLLFLPALARGHRMKDNLGRPIPGWKTYFLPVRHALKRLGPDELPRIETEVSRLDIGPAVLLGIPGEIFPELLIGGYQGQFRAGHPLISEANPDPPDLSRAPKGPYLKDRMPGRLKFVVGLANDELGYLMPAYDYKIQDSLTLLPRLPGHHYEETNSVGKEATRIVMEAARRLLK